MASVKQICANRSCGLWLRLAVGFLIFASLRGFGRDDIKVYRVPKERTAVQSSPATPKLKWKTPDGWTEVGARRNACGVLQRQGVRTAKAPT